MKFVYLLNISVTYWNDVRRLITHYAFSEAQAYEIIAEYKRKCKSVTYKISRIRGDD